jgi:hypothetical protein
MKHAYAWPTAISDHYFCRQITTLTHYFGIMFGIIFFCGMNIFALHVAFFLAYKLTFLTFCQAFIPAFDFASHVAIYVAFYATCCLTFFWFDFDSLSGIATEIWSLRLTPGSVH